MLFIRPGELMPALGDIQIYLAFICGAMLFSIYDLHNQVKWKTMLQQPVNLCVIGVTSMVLISRVSTGNLSGTGDSMTMMIKVLMYFLMLVAVVNTPLRLRYFLMTTAICSTLMIAMSVKDYHNFCNTWLGNPELEQVMEVERLLPTHERKILRHIPDRDGVDKYGNEIWFFRLCGLGIFHDPNDLSLLIVITSIISVYFLTDPKLSVVRLLWLIPLVIMANAMHLTYSRGGLLAGGMATMAWLVTRYGKKVAVPIGLLGAAAVPVLLGRAGNINVSSGTGQQRIQIWSDGLMAIRNSRLIFGIGQGQYTEISTHVAHNSYVHAFVELGFVGGTLFFGCFFLPAFTFYLMKRHNFQIEDPELRRLFPYIPAMLAGWCMGMCSLSRCYVPPTYMVAGICAVYINLVGFYRNNPRPLLVMNYKVFKPWVTCSAALLMGAYVFVRVFARWS